MRDREHPDDLPLNQIDDGMWKPPEDQPPTPTLNCGPSLRLFADKPKTAA
jgi:hypothetical protein